MRKLGTVVALLAMASTAGAQATDCPAGANVAVPTPGQAGQNAARDVCLRAKDVFQLFAPQLGALIAGGNTTLGQGGTLGGIGHFAIDVRVNALRGDLPEIDKFSTPSTTFPQSQELPSRDAIVPLPTVDGALGIYKGFPLGLTNVGGVDLLVSATYIPSVGEAGEDFVIAPETNLKLGFGARVGLLQESLVVPGVSFSFMKRDLPTTTITGTATGMSMEMRDAAIKTSSWRLVASKSLILFGVAAGIGQDKFDQSATFQGTANTALGGSTTFGPFTVGEKMTRTNYFVSGSMNLLLLKLVAEIGQSTGGSLSNAPFNTFSSGRADDSRMYGSVGLRVGF